MSRRLRVCDLNRPLLLPPSLQDWLPERHLARFVSDVVDGLDLSAIYAAHNRKDGRGLAAYHPVMMVRLLLYGYCLGVESSRQIERRTHADAAFRCLAAGQHPDRDSIVGLVKLGHVASDGTKLQGNASKHKAMGCSRMNRKEKALKAEVEKLLEEAGR